MSMDEQTLAPVERRKRLEPFEIAPFLRATKQEHLSLYWAGGFTFPMPFLVRQWFLEFVTRLKAEMEKQELRQENFLRFKTVMRNETERFVKTSREYMPLAGIAVPPDGGRVAMPTGEDIEKSIKDGGFKLEEWIGDYTYWFLKKQDERQRQDFFGMGGMIVLWLKKDPKTVPPELDIPEVAQDYLAGHGHDMMGLAQELYSLQDAFLEKSKQVFGEPVKEEPSFEGIPFVLPHLRARHLLEASPETLDIWFDVFDGYLIESPEDGGVVMAFKDPNFDDVLFTVLQGMQAEGIPWPLLEKRS